MMRDVVQVQKTAPKKPTETITAVEIARELKMDPRVARKILRASEIRLRARIRQEASPIGKSEAQRSLFRRSVDTS